ncbi:M56 family metallopeptidase, partial [Pyxidicoccus fallax]
METGWLTHVGQWASAWPEGLWRASWQGALGVALVWALTRAWPRMPASLRAGLWWLVALKFVVSLAWTRPVPLPVLPASVAPSGDSAVSQGAAHEGDGDTTAFRDAARERAGDLAAHRGTVPGDNTTTARAAAPVSAAVPPLLAPVAEPARSSVPWGRVLMVLLLAVWLAGVLWHSLGHVKGWVAMRRLRRSARPLEHPVLESVTRALAAEAGLRRVPELLVSESVASPLATGLLSPVVVLPAKAVRRLPVDALRMALAHELAHLRRGDLWLGWVPALAEALLFFHPLARRAAREYALAREEACDAEALRLTGAEPADYGELLLAFGVARGAGTAAAHGASAHVHALHRRLSMLEHVEVGPTRSRRLLKVALSALGLAALVPFQVVAQESAGASQAKPASPATAATPAKPGSAQPSAEKAGTPASAAPAKPAAPAAESRPSAATKSAAAPAATGSVAAPPAPRMGGV